MSSSPFPQKHHALQPSVMVHFAQQSAGVVPTFFSNLSAVPASTHVDGWGGIVQVVVCSVKDASSTGTSTSKAIILGVELSNKRMRIEYTSLVVANGAISGRL
jgi:hypothetical protein